MRAQAGVLLRAGVVLGLVFTAAGCATAQPQSPEPAALKLVTSGVSDPSGMEALLADVRLESVDGCIVLGSQQAQITPVWPKGYTVEGDESSFEVVDSTGATIAAKGDVLNLGGGGVSNVGADWGNAECGTGTLWLVGEIDRAL